MSRFWLIGCGAMTGAMLTRWIDTGLDPASVTVVDPASTRTDVRVLPAVPDETPPERLMIGVKPQMLGGVAPGIARAIGPETLVLSILAGTTTASLAGYFPAARSIIRVMPNLPVAIGAGVVALYAANGARDPALTALMAPLGLVEWLDDEGLFDVVTALSGSGPAFAYRFAAALADGGAALGLDAARSDRIARATMAGAAALAAASSEPLATLADRVASRGGSTRVGLDVLDGALDRLIAATLRAAAARNAELAQLSEIG